ncbi:HD domain-containing protein [Petralouisia muris]|uniref:HD domain-containing protein n=1 Tax=Petralouisia muris TaxID=3032872 RepID=UPI00144129D7|nr:ATP-binding protein [Petralouisia muris]
MPYQAQLTLEKHFKNIAEKEEDSQRLFSLWDILKKDLVERLSSSRSVFVHFSLHDATHSRKIITMIEMFLGEERISNLSPSDTFMLLCSAYAHDYGMALSADRVYQALGDDKFLWFLEKQSQNPIQEERDSFKILLELVKGREDKTIKETGKKVLQEIYRAILLALQQYLRPLHSYGVISLEKDLGDLLHGRIDRRIINSIVQICRLHGSSVDGMMEMEKYANGLESGIYHPRFIAAMLRLGDLLDLDNGRFPLWFNGAVDEDSDFLPESSRLHYQKHESVTHFYVGPKKIQIVFHCGGSDAVKVARLAEHWLSMLREECGFLTMHWSEITPSDFGRPPYLEMGDIYVKDESYPEFFLYTADDKKLQMQMPQQKVLELLEGTNIYNDRYIGIRELVQNAVDASLLQMWYDLTHNKYAHLIEKQEISSMTDFTAIPSEIFKFYNIKIELIRDLDENEIFVVVKDRGTGIGKEDLDSMANIGQGKEKNERLQRILHSMPEWMKPAGIFGIGLQSVFQLTDQINFYTRQPNRPEYKIVFNSYGKDMGRIEKQEIHDHDVDGDVFYDNYSQGTNVKFAIKREHLWENRSEFQYYDWKFDKKDEFNAIYAEMAHVIDKKLKETPFDYFNVEFCTMTIKNEDKEETSHHNRVYGFFRESKNKRNEAYKYRLSTLQLRYENAVNNREAIFWIGDGNAVYYDKADKLFYRIEALPCIKCSEDQKRSYFHLPCRKDKSLRVWYKFSKIEDISVLTDVPLHVPVFSGLLQMDIIIFDYPADKYLNIDRNHLRNQDNLTRDKIEKIQEKYLR